MESNGAQDDNPFLDHPKTSRPCPTTPAKALLSLFSLHNDLMNVLTHLFGFVFFLRLAWTLWHSQPLSSRLALAFAASCTSATMILSATYHLFRCVSLEYFYVLLTADFMGINLSFLASNFLMMYVAELRCTGFVDLTPLADTLR
jgi:predicted membrane channel-forming protein YqfA (hemolysin III family)